MSTVKERADELEAALGAVADTETKRFGDVLTPPSLVLGPPALTFGAMLVGPTDARFVVYAVERADQFALERLWELVPRVCEAIDVQTDAVVRSAEPAAYDNNGALLPCYEIIVEVGLS